MVGGEGGGLGANCFQQPTNSPGSAGASVRHAVCVPVMKTPGDVFHARHIKVETFDPECSRPAGLGRAAGKDTPLFINRGLSDRDGSQKE